VGATYPWLPLQINGSAMALQWYDRWYLDLEAGTWSATNPSDLTKAMTISQRPLWVMLSYW